jgi:hypothetical protein
MPVEQDLDPDAMTEKERLAKRRYQAYFAFETMPSSRLAHFDVGQIDHMPKTEEP